MKTFNQYITEKIKLSSDRFGGEYNGIEYVDLGLKSGTLWATCNLDAKKPEEPGGYYAWGELEEKDEYSWANYKFANYTQATKYNKDDSMCELELEDDVANVKLGGKWHIPTVKQVIELNFLEHEYVENYNDSGMNGILFTGLNNTKLFLPYVGYKIVEHDPEGMYKNTVLWTSTLQNNPINAHTLLYADKHGNGNTDKATRNQGLQIRPVFERK